MIQHSCDKSHHLDQICLHVLNAWEEISENMNKKIDDNKKISRLNTSTILSGSKCVEMCNLVGDFNDGAWSAKTYSKSSIATCIWERRM